MLAPGFIRCNEASHPSIHAASVELVGADLDALARRQCALADFPIGLLCCDSMADPGGDPIKLQRGRLRLSESRCHVEKLSLRHWSEKPFFNAILCSLPPYVSRG